MFTRIVRYTVAALLCGAAGRALNAQAAPDGGPLWTAVQDQLWKRGGMQPGDVLRFGFPRTDLTVVAAGVTLRPALALGSWAAFKRDSSGMAVMMGDLVLLESEVNPVISALQANGILQTAIHHHVMDESPRILYVHFDGHGDAAQLAGALRSALATTRTPTGPVQPGAPAPAIDLDTAAIARTLRATGRPNGGVFQFNIPRAERITAHGIDVPASMGTGTVINFQPTGAGRAAITGDFVMTGSEVNPVIRALRGAGIQVTALHSHMLDESPRLFFMHFWANDDATRLATGLRSALDQLARPPR